MSVLPAGRCCCWLAVAAALPAEATGPILLWQEKPRKKKARAPKKSPEELAAAKEAKETAKKVRRSSCEHGTSASSGALSVGAVIEPCRAQMPDQRLGRERPLAHARPPHAGRWMSRLACSHSTASTHLSRARAAMPS